MNSSGIKRGLAVSAISALAIAGIPALATPASANPIATQVGAGQVFLYNSDATPLSVKPDGANSTARLEAGAGSDITSVTFQYQLPGGTFQDISTVTRNDDGAFSFEWAIPAALLGTTVTLRATGTPAGGTADNSDSVGVVLSPAGGAVKSYNLADGSAKGVFDAPYGGVVNQFVAVNGTASENGALEIGRVNGEDTFASVTGATAATATGSTTPTFQGVLNITGYDFTGAPDEIVLAAGDLTTPRTDSQDFEAYTLYNQTITTVTATSSATNVPAGTSANVTVTVVDQNGNPIAGAEVRSSAAGNPVVGTTNGNGQVLNVQQGAGSVYYYANATDGDAYSVAEGDKRSADVAITEFVPVVTSIAPVTVDGLNFDDDEYAPGDVYFQAKDQFGNDVNADGRTVEYYFVVTPFAGGAPIRVPATGTPNSVATESGTGRFNITVPVAQPSGTYELFAGLADIPGTAADESQPVTSKAIFKIGQAALTFDGTSPQSAPAAGSTAVSGKLALEDGTPLVGRTVRLNYNRGPAGTTVGADATPDSGFADGSDAGTDPDLTVDVVTGANGAFSVTVVDPAETGAGSTQGSELGGTVTANTVAGTVANNPDQDNPNATQATRVVNFVSNTPPAGATVDIAEIAGAPRPGEVVNGTATVTVPDGADIGTERDAVGGQQVTLTLPAASGAYFTDGTAAPAPVIGADAGTFRNLGKSITVTSSSTGVVNFQLAIGRDAGFDDDGLVEAIVTASIGTPASQSDTEDVDFTSANPLNGGAVEIVKSPASEQGGSTTPADPFQRVFFDLFTTDQFGNRVGSETVTVAATGADDDTVVSVRGQDGFVSNTATSDFAADGDFSVSASQADTVTVRATWQTETTRYTATAGNGSPVTTTVANGETLTDTETFAVANSVNTATLTGSPEDTAAVNTAVTETFTLLDDEGNPVAGQGVTFTRVGPNGQTETVTRTTNANGVAQYVFTGTAAGTVTITAEANDANATSATDTVTFTATPPQEPVTFVISSNPETGVNVGDTVVETVTVEDGDGNGFAGATVEFTRSDTGATVTRTTNAAGQASFTVSRSTSGAVNITAVVDYGTGTTTLNDRIVFAKTKINVNTTVGNANGGRTDIIRINVTGENEANGATATLFKRVNGRNVRLTSKTVNANGQAEFRVRDLNKRQLTLYFVRVSPTNDTLGATGPVKKVR